MSAVAGDVETQARPRSARAATNEAACTDAELFDRARAGDTSARDQLVERFLPLAARLARKFFHTGAEREDLIQVANIGLVKALDRYDPGRGVAFISFATPTITGELKRFIRDTRWAVRVPRGLQERTLQVEAGVTELEPRLGRSPTPAEVASYLGTTREEVIEAFEAAASRDPSPLDNDEEAGGTRAPGSEDPGYERVVDRAVVAPLFKALPAREKRILRLRFGRDMSQSEIAREIGVSQMHVCRLIRRSLDELASEVAQTR